MTALVVRAALFALVGLALGLVHFAALHRGLRLHLRDAFGLRAVAFHLARFAVTAAAWVVLARAGSAIGLLAALAGFVGARPLATRPWRTA